MGCSFCGGNGQRSKEHIYSNCILKLFQNVAPLTIDPIRKVIHNGDPVIKDLCRGCNSKMSYLDADAGTFFSQYGLVTHPMGTVFSLNSELLSKWCAKTCSNMERSFNRNRFWWKSFINAFKDDSVKLDNRCIDVFMAAWKNKSPIPNGGYLEGLSVRVLDFSDANVDFCYSIQQGSDGPDYLYSLKIGSLVFLVCIWEENKNKFLLYEELKSYGWELLDTDFVSIRADPFNTWTSDLIGMIHDPSKVFINGQLVDIPSNLIF